MFFLDDAIDKCNEWMSCTGIKNTNNYNKPFILRAGRVFTKYDGNNTFNAKHIPTSAEMGRTNAEIQCRIDIEVGRAVARRAVENTYKIFVIYCKLIHCFPQLL